MRWSAVILLLLGLGAGWLAATVLQPPSPAAAPRSTRPVPAAPDPRLEVVLARLEAIESVLREQSAAPPPAAVPATDAPVRAPEAADDARPDPWPEVAADELLLQAKVAAESEGGSARALEMYRAVTGRDVAPEQRATAFLGIADVYRGVKEYGAAARAFREARDAAGPGSEKGQSAWRQLGWALANDGRSAEALREAELFRGEPGLSRVMRANADWMVALFGHGAGDVERARGEFESIVSRCTDHPEAHLRSFATMATEALANLK